MALREDLERALARIKKLEDDVSDLQRFRAWMLGLGASAGALVAFFADALKKRLGLS